MVLEELNLNITSAYILSWENMVFFQLKSPNKCWRGAAMMLFWGKSTTKKNKPLFCFITLIFLKIIFIFFFKWRCFEWVKGRNMTEQKTCINIVVILNSVNCKFWKLRSQIKINLKLKGCKVHFIHPQKKKKIQKQILQL